MKYNDNGEYKEIVVKSTDTLPVGTEVDFDGNEVPSGWTEVTQLYEKTADNVSLGGNGTFANITDCSITASRSGLALIIINANFYANATGVRVVNIAVNGSSITPSAAIRTQAVSTSNQATTIMTSKAIFVNEGDIVCPRAAQTSGSSLSCDFQMQLIYL